MITVLLASLAAAQDVCSSGCTFSSVGAAVASVTDGNSGTFEVATGNYVEPGQIAVGTNRSVTLVALGAVSVSNVGPGPVFHVTGVGAELVVDGFSLTTFNDRIVEVVDAGQVEVVGSVLHTLGLQFEGTAVYAESGTFSARDSVFLDNIATTGGGHVLARNSTVDLVNCLFTGGFATRGGAAMFEGETVAPTVVTISGSRFEDNLAADAGGAIAVTGNVELSIVDSWFEGNAAELGGVIADYGNVTAGIPDVTISDSMFQENRAEGTGGVIASTNTTWRIEDTTFRENTANDGGALWVQGGLVSMDRTVLCRNEAMNGGAVWSRTPEVQRWYNNRLVENSASFGGGAIDHDGGTLEMRHHNFLGNAASVGGSVRSDAEVLVRNSLVGWTSGASALVARTVREDWNAYWQNIAGDLREEEPDFVLGGETRETRDPQLDRYVAGAGCDAVDDFYSWYGPLRGGADVWDLPNLDGSPSDLGAYGGEFAPDRPWFDDIDGDGYPPLYDCVEGDGAFHPEATDIAYDGFDQDCDGANDYDVDQDGFDFDVDCDDLDPNTFPGADERAGRGDQDCDGRIDADGDGYSPPQDCNDEDDRIHPGAAEDANPAVDLDCEPPGDVLRPLEPRTCSTIGAAPSLFTFAGLILWVLVLRRRYES